MQHLSDCFPERQTCPRIERRGRSPRKRRRGGVDTELLELLEYDLPRREDLSTPKHPWKPHKRLPPVVAQKHAAGGGVDGRTVQVGTKALGMDTFQRGKDSRRRAWRSSCRLGRRLRVGLRFLWPMTVKRSIRRLKDRQGSGEPGHGVSSHRGKGSTGRSRDQHARFLRERGQQGQLTRLCALVGSSFRPGRGND